MSISRHLCVLLLLGLLSSCASSKKPKKDKKVGEAKVIGVIELVNPEQNYVLINCEQRVDIPTGTEVISQGVNGTDAKLKVTPERKGNYITADITQGTPQLRDLVIYKVPSEDNATPAPASTAAAAAVAAPMAPVMQADVIPPLDTPFQQMAPLRSAMGVQPQPQSPAPPPSPAPQQRLAPPPPAPPPVQEPEADVSKLPPVIR